MLVQVMDEADRILNDDFEKQVDKLLRVLPRERNTFLFSATMTQKVVGGAVCNGQIVQIMRSWETNAD